jgi:hypothetical protein
MTNIGDPRFEIGWLHLIELFVTLVILGIGERDTHNSENPEMPLASSLTGFANLVSHAQRMAQ